MGTGAGIAWFQLQAWGRGDPATIAAVSKLVVKADWTFTLTAGLIQPLTGAWLIQLAGWEPFAPWLVAAYGLYGFIFACWAPVVWLQIRIRDLAIEAASANTPLPEAARRAYRVWFLLGWPAFAAMMALIWLMIAKPGF